MIPGEYKNGLRLQKRAIYVTRAGTLTTNISVVGVRKRGCWAQQYCTGCKGTGDWILE